MSSSQREPEEASGPSAPRCGSCYRAPSPLGGAGGDMLAGTGRTGGDPGTPRRGDVSSGGRHVARVPRQEPSTHRAAKRRLSAPRVAALTTSGVPLGDSGETPCTSCLCSVAGRGGGAGLVAQPRREHASWAFRLGGQCGCGHCTHPRQAPGAGPAPASRGDPGRVLPDIWDKAPLSPAPARQPIRATPRLQESQQRAGGEQLRTASGGGRLSASYADGRSRGADNPGPGCQCDRKPRARSSCGPEGRGCAP